MTLAANTGIGLYCICAECIRCGCGLWEKHHSYLWELTYPDAVYLAMDAEIKRKRRKVHR